jgi:hypothetical protein
MRIRERRLVKRHVMRLSIAFCRFSPFSTPICIGHVKNISAHGICFSSFSEIALGTLLQVSLATPEGVRLVDSPPQRWTGSVVHVRSQANGEVDIGMRFMVGDNESLIANKTLVPQLSA